MATDGVRWLDSTETTAWRGLLDVHAHLRALLSRDLQRSSGLSMSDYDVLVHLTDLPEGRRRFFELCEVLAWEKSRLSKQVGRMVVRGLVEKEDCEEDLRGAYVAITRAGREAIESAAPRHAELVRQLVFDPLSRAEVEQLASVLQKLRDSLEFQGSPRLPS